MSQGQALLGVPRSLIFDTAAARATLRRHLSDRSLAELEVLGLGCIENRD